MKGFDGLITTKKKPQLTASSHFEEKKQKVTEDDFMPDDYENEVYHRPPTIDERLEPYEIGTIVKKRNTNK